MYDYLFLDLAPAADRPVRGALAEHLAGSTAAALRAAGGAVLGAWTSQLGWKSSEVAVLVGWRDGVGRDEAALQSLLPSPLVRSSRRDRLSPTDRPKAGARPRPGGIYVHRWFVIGERAVPEFVALSVLGWRDFETRYETSIYGLFQADRSDDDIKTGAVRMLLLTQYRDHGVWETSRDPSSDAMAAFARRQKLTRSSWAGSSLLLPPAG